MFYRLTVDLAFSSQHPVDEIAQQLLPRLPHAVTINAGLPNEERGSIILQKCYHDEDPSKPCEVIVEHYTI